MTWFVSRSCRLCRRRLFVFAEDVMEKSLGQVGMFIFFCC